MLRTSLSLHDLGPPIIDDVQKVIVRDALPSDVPVILSLIKGLAEYERAPNEVSISEAELLRDGFGDRPLFECLIAQVEEEAVGMALFFPFYSTWKGPGIHLEDLFVLPSARGCGAGKALLTAVASIAAERGCARLQWQVLDWNQPAIDFYNSLGAKFLDEWRIMRVTGEALCRLAWKAEQTGAESTVQVG
jgi:GNAT superfamily N-acetyltransferase